MNKIGLVRHGSTDWNKEGRAQGSSDIPLNEEGLIGAQKLSERLGQEEWDIIFSSNLSRAVQTANAIGKNVDVPIQLDPRLREVGGGLIEGTTEAERIEKWGDNWRELDLGIETKEAVIERALSLLEEINNQFPNKNILLVSHGAFIAHLLKNLLPNEQLEGHLKNNSFTVVAKAEHGWSCELYNCTKHLSEE